jgi:hypothetical protein
VAFPEAGVGSGVLESLAGEEALQAVIRKSERVRAISHNLDLIITLLGERFLVLSYLNSFRNAIAKE